MECLKTNFASFNLSAFLNSIIFLQFRASDVIAITGKVDDQWLEGELAGRRGIFPITFVQLNADLSRIPFTTTQVKTI